ncbi:MAG: hypothetical protein K8U03_04510 [Planctomycetia bacterium]|nr:hypothetical protein [Planctomycetia bacterium]
MAGRFFGAFRLTVAVPRWLATASLFVPLVCGGQQAPSPATTPPLDSGGNVELVAALVRDLGADDYRIRARADEQLAKLGSQASLELAKAGADADPEVRLRARELLKHIRIEELWRASRFQYLDAGKPASKILAAIAEQTGNHLLLGDQYGNFEDKPLDVRFERGEYWPALDDICRRTSNKLRPHYDTREPALVVTAGESGKFPVAYAGAIRAQISSARRAYSEEIDYETSKSDRSHTFQLNLQMMWEDRFRLIAYRSQPELVVARTNAGTEIAATQPGTSGWNVAGGGTRQLTMNLRLHPPATAASKLETLTLKWGVIAVGDMATLTINDLERRGPHYQDDVELRVEQVEQSSGLRCEVGLLVLRDLVLSDPQEAFFQECEVELLDQHKTPYRKQGQNNSYESDGARMKFTFIGESTDSKPTTLRFGYPRIRSQRDVMITFKDVPLPNGRPE